MVTNNVGQVLSKADIPGLMESVAAATGNAAPSNALGDIETILKFFERAVPLFEQASQTLMRMQSFERQDPNQQYQSQGVIETMPSPITPTPNPTPNPEPKKISGIKVYSAALGALNDLNKLDPDLTVSAALEMARNYKETLLPMIEEKLGDLYED
jgi:hypothetical protein